MNSVITLTKGERATRVNGSIVKVKNADLNKLSWKSNQLTFENTDMITTFKAIESHFKTDIDYSDATNDLSNCLVRTRYVNESLEQVIKELSTLQGFDYTTSQWRVAFKLRGSVERRSPRAGRTVAGHHFIFFHPAW